ncbi:hypothetical protein Tco_1118904 [Tanacetum coccineum]
MRHFARECRTPRNKEGQFRNQDNTRKQGNNEDTSSKEMLAIDGVGFDLSDMAEEQVQINMALMAFSDSELNQIEFTSATYKRGLETVEEQLILYRKNEVLFSKEVAVLKREVACKDYEINVLKSEFEKVKQEKEGIEFKIEKFDKASKYLDKLLGCQITDKSKKGLGYNVVPPPHPLIYNRPKKLDLSYSGRDEFKDPEFKIYGSKDSKQECNIVCDKKSDASKENSDDSLVKEKVSEDTSSFVESLLNVDKETIFHDKKIEIVKPINHEKPVKKSVRLNLLMLLGQKVDDEAVHKELGDRMERAATTASSLEGEQDSDAQTRFEAASKTPMIHLSQEISSSLQQRGERQRWSFQIKKRIWSQDPSKQGRMSRTKFEDVETEHAEEVEYILEQITPSKGLQGEEQSQESSEVHLDVLRTAKIFADAS